MARQYKHGNRGRIGRGLVLSLFLHGQVLLPLVIWVFWWGAPDDNEVGLSFEDVKDDELPPNLPAVDKPAEPKKVAKAEAKPEALAERDPGKKLEAPVPAPMPVPAPAPAPPQPESKPNPVVPPEEMLNRKIVDLDMGKDVEEPKDAKYLAQKNNRAEQETRAKQTNLEKEQKGKAAEPSDGKDKIAQLEDKEAKAGQRAKQFQDSQVASEPRSTLSMRVPGLEKTAAKGEKLPEDSEGMFSRAEDGRRSVEGRHGSAIPESPTPHLSRQGYTSAFGDDAELAAAVAKQQKSQHKGKFTERKEKVLSALENFINEVTPGNQTELNTRAAPFAQFIAHMHRQIHEKWAFGFLNDMDRDFRDSPMNDLKLIAKLEIVLNGDGDVDKISMVRTSGNTGFDSAAIGSVYAAAPFPTPPSAILSGNGKVYIHWKFHRNGDACGTPGVNYFILDNGDKRGGKKELPPNSGHASLSPARG